MTDDRIVTDDLDERIRQAAGHLLRDSLGLDESYWHDILEDGIWTDGRHTQFRILDRARLRILERLQATPGIKNINLAPAGDIGSERTVRITVTKEGQ